MKNLFNLYVKHFGTTPANILEIGSRDGHDAETLRKLANLPPEVVCCVEPHPVSANMIRKTYPKFKVVEAAIIFDNGIYDFNAIPNSYTPDVVGQSSLMVNRNGGPENWIRVIGITGISLFDLLGWKSFDLVKIDVEGTAHEVIDSIGYRLKLTKMIHVEVETEPIWDIANADTIGIYLTNWGFEKIDERIPYKGQLDQVWVKK